MQDCEADKVMAPLRNRGNPMWPKRDDQKESGRRSNQKGQQRPDPGRTGIWGLL